MNGDAKNSVLVFSEAQGPVGRDNVNCVIQLDEMAHPKDVDLNDLHADAPPMPTAKEAGSAGDVTDAIPKRQDAFNRNIEKVDRIVKGFLASHSAHIKWAVYLVLICLYVTYVICAVVLDFQRALALFVVSMLLLCYALYRLLKYFLGARVALTAVGCRQRKHRFLVKNHVKVKWAIYLIFTGLIIVLCGVTGVIESILDEPERLKSLFGLFCMLVISFLLSSNPGMINWRTVFWGLWLQLFLGILILRTQIGYEAFHWLGNEVEAFLGFVNVGAEFLFGPAPLDNHRLLFVVLPVIIFTSAVFALLYYWRVMQALIELLAKIMHYSMGTSGAESFATASNIFVGMTVAPLAIKPYLDDMTESEMHAVIVGGFATIAGSVLAIFISFGISASHLLAASFMSAPAALVTSKMFLPETKVPKTAQSAKVETSKVQVSNALEALYVGAIDGLKICAYIIGNILAIISVLAFINSALAYLGGLVNIDNLSFQLICRYLMYPIAWLLGVDRVDCLVVAELIGTKTFLNEIVAYENLADYVEAGQITARSQVIATYALCGFANLGSIGVMMGGLIPLVPHRKSEISRLCVRAFVSALIALFMTACIAGLLYDQGQMFNPMAGGGDTATNTTTAATTMTTTMPVAAGSTAAAVLSPTTMGVTT